MNAGYWLLMVQRRRTAKGCDSPPCAAGDDEEGQEGPAGQKAKAQTSEIAAYAWAAADERVAGEWKLPYRED